MAFDPQPIPFITIRQAADRLGVTPRRIHQYMRAGRLPAVLAGNYIYLIPLQNVLDFVRKPHGRPTGYSPVKKS